MIEQVPPTGPATQPGSPVQPRTVARVSPPPDGLSRLRRLATRLAGHGEALTLLADLDAVAQELSEYQLAAERLRFLSEAGELLGSPTDIDSTLQRVARLAVPRLADACTIYLLDENGAVRQVAGQHVSPDAKVLLENLGQGFPPTVAGEDPASVSLDIGGGLLSSDGVLDLFETPSVLHGTGPMANGTCSSMTVPLRARGRSLGLICLTTSVSERRFTPADLDLARELADRAALAVDNAHLFEEAESAEALLDTLFRSTPVGLALLDRDLRYVRVNDALARLFGRPPQEIVGRIAPDLTPRFSTRLQDAARRLLEGKQPLLSVELDGTPPGRDRPGYFLLNLYPVRTPSGHCIGLGAAVVDITERKEAELAGQAAREAAEAASRAKSQFLGVISHELRTPLTTVIGYADLLIAGLSGAVSERQREQLRRIKTSAWNLVGIIEEILTFSRADAGKEEVHLEVTDVGRLVREAAEIMEPQAHSRGLRFFTVVPQERVLAMTDGGKIRQVLMNLLGNALKFTEEGWIRLGLRVGAAGLELEVSDTGRGIPPADLEAIFEPFRQLDQSSTRQQGGTGLGLTVARQLVRLLGGEIAVASQLGSGSSFIVRLPAAMPQSTASSRTSAVPSGA